MDNLDQRALLARIKQRAILFSIKGAELFNLSSIDQYDRMRYEREIEAHEYVKLLRIGYSYAQAAIMARKNAEKIVENWKEGDSIWEMYYANPLTTMPTEKKEIGNGSRERFLTKE